MFFFLGTSKTEYITIGKSPYMRVDRGWTRIGGYFKIQDQSINISAVESALFYIQIPKTNSSYLIDSASMTEITDDPKWKTAANQRINDIRKRDIRIR